MARDVGDEGADGDRQFEFVVTYDRGLVTAAAHSLVGRLAPGQNAGQRQMGSQVPVTTAATTATVLTRIPAAPTPRSTRE